MDGETDVSNAGTITQNYANCQKKKKKEGKTFIFYPISRCNFLEVGAETDDAIAHKSCFAGLGIVENIY